MLPPSLRDVYPMWVPASLQPVPTRDILDFPEVSACTFILQPCPTYNHEIKNVCPILNLCKCPTVLSVTNLAECFARQETLHVYILFGATRLIHAIGMLQKSVRIVWNIHISPAIPCVRLIFTELMNLLFYHRSSTATCLIWDSCSNNSGTFCGWYHVSYSLRLLSLIHNTQKTQYSSLDICVMLWHYYSYVSVQCNIICYLFPNDNPLWIETRRNTCVTIQYEHPRKNIVHFIGWVLWIIIFLHVLTSSVFVRSQCCRPL